MVSVPALKEFEARFRKIVNIYLFPIWVYVPTWFVYVHVPPPLLVKTGTNVPVTYVQALRRAEIMTSEKANSVKLTFGKNNLTITANSPEVGEARETLAINYKGKELAIAFNPRYLIDPLNALAEDEVFIELIDELSPGVLKINGPFLYVVMPMRLN